jgi:methylenetetrahydrofolate dehydrogenase (NADP+)/methenyltetrahydrofolate cyclohydrolase
MSDMITSDKIIDGKLIAKQLVADLAVKVSNLKLVYNIIPRLAIVQVGDNPSSTLYIQNKITKCTEIGIAYEFHHYNETISEADLSVAIININNDKNIHGIIVQLPLPKHIEVNKIINLIDPKKDVDGFTPTNTGLLLSNQECLVPCTPQGCLILLKTIFKSLAGKKAVVIGRSNIVGKPLSYLLLKENCTVTMAHSYTNDLKKETLSADIIIAATGNMGLIKGDYIKEGAVVIDVGINVVNEGIKKIFKGDVNFDEALTKVSAITPVPGGVGPMTIACLLKNVMLACCNINNIDYNNL